MSAKIEVNNCIIYKINMYTRVNCMSAEKRNMHTMSSVTLPLYRAHTLGQRQINIDFSLLTYHRVSRKDETTIVAHTLSRFTKYHSVAI